MTELAIIGGLVTAVTTGAGAVWLFLQGELKKRDEKITKLEAMVFDLTAKYNRLEGKTSAEDSMKTYLQHIDVKLDLIIQAKKPKKTKSV